MASRRASCAIGRVRLRSAGRAGSAVSRRCDPSGTTDHRAAALQAATSRAVRLQPLPSLSRGRRFDARRFRPPLAVLLAVTVGGAPEEPADDAEDDERDDDRGDDDPRRRGRLRDPEDEHLTRRLCSTHAPGLSARRDFACARRSALEDRRDPPEAAVRGSDRLATACQRLPGRSSATRSRLASLIRRPSERPPSAVRGIVLPAS